MTRLRPKPRVMMSSRIREEFREGLETVVEDLRHEGWEDAQRYDVLEMLLDDLLTYQGRQRVKALFRERFGSDPAGD